MGGAWAASAARLTLAVTGWSEPFGSGSGYRLPPFAPPSGLPGDTPVCLPWGPVPMGDTSGYRRGNHREERQEQGLGCFALDPARSEQT